MSAQEKNNFKKTLNSLLKIGRDLFGFSLIIYLILFLLDYLLPGFVSNNFSLNWILGIVLVLAVISAFTPESEAPAMDKDKPKPVDYLFLIGLGIVGAALVFYKIEAGNLVSWIIAIISGGLVIGLGMTILTTEEEEIEEQVEEEFEKKPKKQFSFVPLKLVLKTILAKKINLPLTPILLLLVLTVFLIPKNFASFINLLRKPKIVEVAPTPTPTPEPTFWDTIGSVEPSSEITIEVLNGGAEAGAAGEFVKILEAVGFTNFKTGNADNYDYQEATIKFAPENKEQAKLIKQLLNNEYSTIIERPSTASAEIIVILGSKKPEEFEEKWFEMF